MSLEYIFLTNKRVPLQRPAFGFKFLSIIIGWPIFNISLCGGNPETLKLFKNSVGYKAWLESSKTESHDIHSVGSPFKKPVAKSLISSTIWLFGATITRDVNSTGSIILKIKLIKL